MKYKRRECSIRGGVSTVSMKREIISQAVGGIDARYIQEAAEYVSGKESPGEKSAGEQAADRGASPHGGFPRGGSRERSARALPALSMAAAVVLCLLAGGMVLLSSSGGGKSGGRESGGGEVAIDSSADAPEMICVDGRLYQRSLEWGEPDGGLDGELVYLGRIESCVTDGQGSYATSENGILTGIWVEDEVPGEDFQANTPIVGAEVYQWGEDIIVRVDGEYRLYKFAGKAGAGTETQAEAQGEKVWCGEDCVSIDADSLQAAEAAVKDYYLGTVFGLVSMEVKEQTAEEITFSVRVTKGGVIQEPDRSITLRLEDGGWKVVNEGY